jgi:hypothetical protein
VPFLFEFMDQPWLPASLHATLRDVLRFHLRVTLLDYYRWAAESALKAAEQGGIRRVGELGAGAAGFSETLAGLIRDRQVPVEVEVSDLHPNAELYRRLQARFPGIVKARTEPVDFVRTPSEAELVVMSAAFHHIPPGAREGVLRALATKRVMVFESVTRNVHSILGCAVGFLPALLTPLYFLGNAEGRWRRFLWCWLVPAAPLMVAFDGMVSCLRCWTEDEWRRELRRIGLPDQAIAIERRGFSHMISWA